MLVNVTNCVYYLFDYRYSFVGFVGFYICTVTNWIDNLELFYSIILGVVGMLFDVLGSELRFATDTAVCACDILSKRL